MGRSPGVLSPVGRAAEGREKLSNFAACPEIESIGAVSDSLTASSPSRRAIGFKGLQASLCSPGRDLVRTLQEAQIVSAVWQKGVSYKALAKLGIDHRPRKTGRGRQEVDGLPWAHTIFGNLKTWLRGTFPGVSPKHLPRCWRSRKTVEN